MENRRILIDTSILIDYLRCIDKQKTKFVSLFKEYTLCVSTITIFELLNGATTEDKQLVIKKVLKPLVIVDFNISCAEKASEIFRILRKQNKLIEFRDILIGATAIENDLPVATFNKKHFERLPDIELIT